MAVLSARTRAHGFKWFHYGGGHEREIYLLHTIRAPYVSVRVARCPRRFMVLFI